MGRRFHPPGVFFVALLVLLSETSPGSQSITLSAGECGTRMIENEIETGTRIVGGRDAQAGAWPWQVSLQVFENGVGYVHVCGGSLIDNDSVLTAAHCIKKKRNPKMWRAAFGFHHLYEETIHTINSPVKAIEVHFDFDKATYDNDIALFKLSKSITYNEYVQPVCLPRSSLHLTNETSCYISGWGLIKENGSPSYILQEAQVELIPLKICNSLDWYMGTVSENNLCAGSESGHVDSCQGDSGGPLVCYFPNDNKYHLIGITSFGYGCGRPKLPGIYVDLAKYRSWVDVRLHSRTTTLCIHRMLTFLTVSSVAFHYTIITSN